MCNARHWFRGWLLGCLASALLSGCGHFQQARLLYERPDSMPPLGTVSDDIWHKHELYGEASDFVIYQSEFEKDTARLNTLGEDHVKEIAHRLVQGQDFPVLVERSMTKPRDTTEHQYPIHPDPVLDMQRREIVVRSLVALGVQDADQRVVVAPALAAGYTAAEARAAYQQGQFGGGFGLGGFGRGIGGFRGGFGGGFGGFGGGVGGVRGGSV